MTDLIPVLDTEESFLFTYLFIYLFMKYGTLNYLVLDSQDINHMRSVSPIGEFASIVNHTVRRYDNTGYGSCTGQPQRIWL